MLVAGSLPASASVVAIAFEFNTAGNDENWQHNGANGGGNNTTGPTSITVAGTGEGVLTAQQLPGNGDLRVLHNPDLTLDTLAYTGWTTLDIRFRQLDGLNGNPQELAGNLNNMHIGVTAGAGGTSASATGSAFVRENPTDSEFWYTATLDISSVGVANINQIRIDPLASTTLDYQLDYARLSANEIAVPEPSSVLLLGLSGIALMGRRRK